MKMRADNHVHTLFSEDSEAEIDDICRSALEKGVKVIALTDHIDYNPVDNGYGYYDREAYFEAVERARQSYGDSLKILTGAEVGEPHLYPERVKELNTSSFDIILGSVHWLGGLFVGDEELLKESSMDEIFIRYYTIMLDMVKKGGFNVLAHMDFPRRYFNSKVNKDNLEIIDEILTHIINSGIALEINSSSLRKGLTDCLPSGELIERYAALGGTMITYGSDAHFADDVTAGFDEIDRLLGSCPTLKAGYFEKGEFREI